METVFQKIDYKINHKEGDPIYIIPFGDVHRDTQSCDVDRWKMFLNKCKSYPQDRTYYICMGDWNDFASSKEQKIIKNSALHDATQMKLDEIAIRDNRRFANEIGFMRGHMIGIIDGNHNWVFKDGTNATHDLASRMNTQYLGWLSYIRISITSDHSVKHHFNSMSLDIVACHGRAGGKLMGTSVNQVDDLKKIFPLADIYIMAHDHQRYAVPCSVLYCNQLGKVKQKRQFLARSGSYKKGYMEGMSGYEVGRLLRPSDIGSIIFKVNVERIRKGNDDYLMLDIEALI